METLQQASKKLTDAYSIASKKLTVAYSILTYIINNLAYSFIEIKDIPEMNIDNLIGVFFHFILVIEIDSLFHIC